MSFKNSPQLQFQVERIISGIALMNSHMTLNSFSSFSNLQFPLLELKRLILILPSLISTEYYLMSLEQTLRPKESLFMSLFKPFIVGSISGSIATSIMQPVDTVKVVIQARREAAGRAVINLSPFLVCSNVVQQSGILGLYRGLDSALLRQFVYCGIRLGLYRVIEDDIKDKENRSLSFKEKIGYSMLSGLIGAAISNPLDMALIRFQADNNLPMSERRNYKHVFDALSKMNKELGFFGMWRGSVPTISRAVVVNMLMLVGYFQTKEVLQKYLNQTKQTTFIRLFGSAISGIVASVGSLPFDNMKTKMLKMKKNEFGELPYRNIVDCFRKSIKHEGFLSLWVGLPTYYCRGAPHAMITILAQDYIHDFISHSASKQ